MAHMQGILFFSKRLNIIFRHVHLNCTCRRQALHKRNLFAFSAVGSFKFYLFNNSAIRNFEQPTKQFCVVTKTSEIKESKSLSEISLSDPDLMNTFRNLLSVYMANKYNRSSTFQCELQNLVNSDEFKNYCNSLEKKLPILSAQELKVLLNCDYFQIPSSSILLQKIYHLIIEKINDYDPIEMLSIYVTINATAHKENPKSKILQLICEEYFRSTLFDDLYKSKNYDKLISFCKNEKIPLQIRKKLLTFFGENLRTIQNELSCHSLCKMFGAFTTESLIGYFKPVMYDVLKTKITEKPNLSVVHILLKGLRHLMLNELCYEECFLNTLAEQILERGPNVGLTLELISHFLELEYLPLPLVKHLEQSVRVANFTLISNKFGLNLAKILSNVYYHPLGYSGDDSNHTECIKKLESLDFKILDIRSYVKWCLYLTTLGSQRKIEYLNELFNYLIDAYKNIETEVKLTAATIEVIITLHAFARKNFPNEVAELPEQFLMKCYDALKADSIKPIKTDQAKSIHQMLGESLDVNTALEHCTTSMYHCIDFTVLLNKENKPQQITIESEDTSSNSILRIENIKKPPLSKLILYQLYRSNVPCQFKNSPVLPGTVQLYLQSFEPFDCRVVLFPAHELRKLYPKHRVPYLVKKINESLQ